MRFSQRFCLLAATSALALAGADLAVNSARAQTFWTGNTSTNWFNAGNWNNGVVPNAGVRAFIDPVAPRPAVVNGGLGVAEADYLAIGNTNGRTGDLTIQNGGVLNITSAGSSDIADPGVGSTGRVTVTGAGSTWTNAGNLSVGTQGTGILTIANGGTVSNGFRGGFIGYTGTGQGIVLVTGSGSTWTVAPSVAGAGLFVGGSTFGSGFLLPGPGIGTLTIADGGAVNVVGAAGTVFVAQRAGSTGTVNIGAAPGNTPVAPGFVNAAQVLFGLGTATLNFNHTATNYVFAPTIAGPGTLNVFSGTTILTANNPYTGNTTIGGGALAVGDPAHPGAALSGGGNVTIAPGATLGGYGSVTGTVFNSGTVAPGSALPVFAGGPFGSLTINGNYVGAGGLLSVCALFSPVTARRRTSS